jgi:hypothetical protein
MEKYTPIKYWSESDRPREKLINKGITALSDSELIAILIGSGNKNKSAVELSREIHGIVPHSFILHMKGKDWKFVEKLSDEAEIILKNSLDFIKEELTKIASINDDSIDKTSLFITNIKKSSFFKTNSK